MSMINVKDVVEMTGLSSSMVHKLIGANKIPHFKFESAIRFDSEKITTWMKSKEATTEPASK